VHANMKYHVQFHPTQPHFTSSNHPKSSIPHTLPLRRLDRELIRAPTSNQSRLISHLTPKSSPIRIPTQESKTNSHPKSPHNRLAFDPTPNITLRTIQIAIESQHLLELAVFEVDGRLASLAVGDILGAGGELGDWEGFDDGCHCW
jgi:hypothetical protein